jgi:hypothetical protein
MRSGAKQRHFCVNTGLIIFRFCEKGRFYLEVCQFARFFSFISSIHSEFQLLFETKANTFLFGTSIVCTAVQDFIINVFVWYVQDF